MQDLRIGEPGSKEAVSPLSPDRKWSFQIDIWLSKSFLNLFKTWAFCFTRMPHRIQERLLWKLLYSFFCSILPWAFFGGFAQERSLQVFEGRVVEGDPAGCCLIVASAGSGPDKQIFNYQTERIVGQGSFGVVYQAKWLETGETVSLCKTTNDWFISSMKAEIADKESKALG